MNDYYILVGLKDNKLNCSEIIDGEYYPFSYCEQNYFFKDFDDMTKDGTIEYDDSDDSVKIRVGDDTIIISQYERLKNEKFLENLNKRLEQRKLLESQRQKLKKRKNKKVSRLAIFSIAIMMSTQLLTGFTSYAGPTPLTDSSINYEYNIDDLGDMVLQGICSIGENTFITAYDSSGENNNSIIYVLDKDNNCIKTTELYNNSHVGGICYDKNSGLFWITDKDGTISAYDYNDVLDNNNVCTPVYEKVDVGENLINYKGSTSAGYIAYHNKCLYVGNFSTSDEGILKQYAMNEDGSVDLASVKEIKFLNKVQGLSFYEKGDDTYLVVSTSYGRYLNSCLKILKFDEDCSNYRDKETTDIKTLPMMEQITFDKDGNLLTLYESNAKKYKTIINKNKRSDVIASDISGITATLK